MQPSYPAYAKRKAARSPLLTDTVNAFLAGGGICALGEALRLGFGRITDADTAKGLATLTLIALAALLTGLDLFDTLARFGGAGLLVPITGFAHAIASTAIDNRDEGFILGLGAKIFTIAGPVILYGTAASVLWGIVYWIMTLPVV